MRADVMPSSVEIVRTDNGSEFTSGEFARVCNKLMIKREFTPPYTQYNGVAERVSGVIEMTGTAGRVEAGQMYRHLELPTTEKL